MKFGFASFVFAGLLTIIANSQESNTLFIGTYTNNGSYGIYVARFDVNAGLIQVVDSIKAENPSYLAYAPATSTLYAVIENGGDKIGAVSSWKWKASSGKWQLLNTQPSTGDHPCYISVDRNGKFAMVANYSSGSLAVLPLASDGSLKPVSQLIQHYGSSINKTRQQTAHVHTAVFSPEERYLVTADLGTDKIQAYAFNSSKVKPLDTAKVIFINASPGGGPRHIGFHPTLPVFYVMEELSGQVSVHQFTKRHIIGLQRILADSVSKQPGSADIHVSQDGRFLYASHRAEANTISVFSIDRETGKLRGVGAISSGGIKPRNFTIDPSGKFLLAANETSGHIVVYRIDSQTGMPNEKVAQIILPSPVCLVFQSQ